MAWRDAGDTFPHEHIREDRDFEKTRRWVVCKIDRESKAMYGLCLHSSIRSDCMDAWMDRVTKEVSIDGLQASSDEERGYLETGEKFGCIHFQSKI